MSIPYDLPVDQYPIRLGDSNGGVIRRLRRYLFENVDNIGRTQYILNHFVDKVFEVESYNNIRDVHSLFTSINVVCDIPQYTDVKITMVNLPLNTDIIKLENYITFDGLYPAHVTPLYRFRTVAKNFSGSDTDSSVDCDDGNDDVFEFDFATDSDSIRNYVESTPSCKKRKPCQDAKLFSIDKQTMHYFDNFIIDVDYIKVGFLIYIEGKDNAIISRRFGGLDISSCAVSSKGGKMRLLSKRILFHMMDYGADLIFTNDYNTFTIINANCKISIVRTSDCIKDEGYNDLKRNTHILAKVQKLSFGRISHAICKSINMYYGNNITTYVKISNNIKHKIYSIPLNVIIPSIRLEHWFNFKSKLNK